MTSRLSTTKVGVVLLGLVLLKCYLVGRDVDPPPAVAQTDDIQGADPFAVDVLGALGNEAPTADILRFMVAWKLGESTTAAFNPLATTQSAEGATCFNYTSEGRCLVKNYTSYEQGVQATVTTITNGHYPHILHGLQANDPEEALNDGELGTWGTGLAAVQRHYDELQATFTAQSVSDGQDEVRQQLVAEALALQGIPYISGGRSASGGDCSGTMQYIFKAVAKTDIGATTFSQRPHLTLVAPNNLRPGDLWYGQYYDDQHTGMVADVDNDGRWDLINNGGLQSNMHVDYNFLETPYFRDHTIDFRDALN